MLNISRLFSLLILLLSSVNAFALPTHHPVPGGTAVLELSDSFSQPEVVFKKKPVAVVNENDKWFALVGLSLSTKPGRYQIDYRVKNSQGQSIKQQKTFVVDKKIYQAQYLEVKNKRKVNPYAKDMKRILHEKKLKNAAKKVWNQTTINTDFIRPVEGRISSVFGLRRFFNKQARRPHSGLDIAAPEGTPIKAIGDGRVIETGDFFFSGNMVYLDHGQGVISLYAHMHKVHVKTGEQVKKGQIIGQVGQTGRVTGPHLHMSIMLNQVAVDPEDWLPRPITH